MYGILLSMLSLEVVVDSDEAYSLVSANIRVNPVVPGVGCEARGTRRTCRTNACASEGRRSSSFILQAVVREIVFILSQSGVGAVAKFFVVFGKFGGRHSGTIRSSSARWRAGVVGEEEGGESNCGGKKRRREEVRGCFGCLRYLQGFKAAHTLVIHRKNKGVWPTGTDGTSVKLLVDLMVVSLLLLIHDHINQRRLHLSMTRT